MSKASLLLLLFAMLTVPSWSQDNGPVKTTTTSGSGKGSLKPTKVEPPVSATANSYPIIPRPTQLNTKSGQFIIKPDVNVYVSHSNQELLKIAQEFVDRFWNLNGLKLTLVDADKNRPTVNYIFFDSSVRNAELKEEGYQLIVSPRFIHIKANTSKGFFYGVQSIYQLLPPSIYSTQKLLQPAIWKVPCCEITDTPRFSYRGMHLDVGRHFFGVDFIKKYIDLLAMHKLNTFHWHLTEDQGWRIEIKKYPNLTKTGAFRKETLIGHYGDKPHKFDGKPYGGFYTQEQIKEVVAYAKTKYVTIVPEIEMPGHALAALAAYPELACTDGPFDVGTIWGIYDDVFCPEEKTFEFLENVLTEVCALFPGKYIHIGGDECPKKRWEESEFCQQLMKKNGLKDEHELQSYFITRIDKFLTSKGKKMIGWDEILEGGLSPNATVMSWRGTEGGIAAAKLQHDVIMTPTDFCYFDYYQGDPATEPLAIGGYLTLETVYNYDPMPADLTTEEQKYILGAQGNLWTEYIPTPDKAEYMAFPRGAAIAETTWTQADRKNLQDFLSRMKVQQERYSYMKVNAANIKSKPVVENK